MKKNHDEDVLDDGMLENLKEFKGSTQLNRAALNFLVKMLPAKDVENL